MAKRAQLPNGTILEFPDETEDAVVDRAVREHVQSERSHAKHAETAAIMNEALSPEQYVGLAEKGLNLATSTLLAPVAGWNWMLRGLVPGGQTGREGYENVMNLAYPPRTPKGQEPGVISDAMQWYVGKTQELGSWTASKLTDNPKARGVIAGSIASAIQAAPLLYSLGRGAYARLKPKPAATAAGSVDDTMGLSAQAVSDVGDKIVTETFRQYMRRVGPETEIPITNLRTTLQSAAAELVRQGKGKSSLAKEISALLENNTGTMPARLLDDVAYNMTTRIRNSGIGVSQAKGVIEAAVRDMDAAGRPLGLNFATDYAASRAFGELYRGRYPLSRITGQFKATLAAYRQANPIEFREIMKDWASRQVKDFVGSTAGGRAFNTARFSRWVSQNEPALTSLLGPETVSVWKAFPKWEGRAGLLKGLSQRVLEAKTGGISRLLSKEFDFRFADSIVEVLTSQDSPLFKALSVQEPVPSMAPLSVQALSAAEINAQDQR